MEMLIVCIIAVLIFGRRLPDIGRSFGRSMMEIERVEYRDPSRMTMLDRTKPPPIWEMIVLPVAGAALIDVLYSEQRFAALFLIPFALAAFRLFLAQFQVPDVNGPIAQRAARRCIAINQLAVLPLTFAECVAVLMAGIKNDTALLCVWPGAFFAAYLAMRLRSRHWWFVANQVA